MKKIIILSLISFLISGIAKGKDGDDFLLPCQNDNVWNNCTSMEEIVGPDFQKRTPINFTRILLSHALPNDTLNSDIGQIQILNGYTPLIYNEKNPNSGSVYGLLPSYLSLNTNGDTIVHTGFGEQVHSKDSSISGSAIAINYLINGANLGFYAFNNYQTKMGVIDLFSAGISLSTFLDDGFEMLIHTSIGPGVAAGKTNDTSDPKWDFSPTLRAYVSFYVLIPTSFGRIGPSITTFNLIHAKNTVSQNQMFLVLSPNITSDWRNLSLIGGLQFEFSPGYQSASIPIGLRFQF